MRFLSIEFTPGTALSQSFALSPNKIRYNLLELVNAYATSNALTLRLNDQVSPSQPPTAGLAANRAVFDHRQRDREGGGGD